ncbi:STAS domain-containing protein [Actinomycetospora sp.]|uniref:STAS domain-containing protein n=1 Tax=Actinomycetospora sp. TaxID=1872135 RepID=UPI002F40EEC7
MPHSQADSDHSNGHSGPGGSAPSFIGSAFEGAHQGRITLRGFLDADAVDRLATHLQGFLEAGVRFVILDAHDVIRADPALVPLLGQVQRRLTRRHGLLTLTGLHPSVLPADDAPVPAPVGRRGKVGEPATAPRPVAPVPGGRR